MEQVKSVVIGDEYDEKLINKLRNILKKEGVLLEEKLSGHYGSQEYQFYKFKLQEKHIALEIETYIGITLTGPTEIIDALLNKLTN